MKNKILYISIVVLAIIIISAQFVSNDNPLYALKINKSNSTLKPEISNFAIEDIESVDKIFIADKQNHSVTLTKVDKNSWKVNNKFYAREDAVKNILQAINRVRVKRPISKSEHNVQIKRLATESRKVEIYQNGKLTKTYYVGGATQDQYGTYMIIEGSSVPFIMHIPGFLGFLTPRFFALEDLWRENFVFKSDPRNVTFVKVENLEEPKRGFTLTKDAEGNYSVLNYMNKFIQDIDTMQVKHFLMHLKKLSYEAMITNMTDSKRDSLIQSKPYHIIKLEAGKNNTQLIKTYHVLNQNHYDDDGNMLKYDPDRMYASFNKNKDLATIQFRTFDKITVDPKFFQK